MGIPVNVEERKKMVLAMEYIAQQVNDEDVIMSWLLAGVPDGDIPYGSFDISDVDDYWLEDDAFQDLMDVFLRLMSYAKESGGLYCNGIVTTEGSKDESTKYSIEEV